MPPGIKVFQPAIDAVLAPHFRSLGFFGSGRDFVRYTAPVLNCINIQGHSGGSACCLSLGVTFDFLPELRETEPSDTSAHECEFRIRVAPRRLADFWWGYSRFGFFNRRTARSMAALFDRVGAPFFACFQEFPRPFTEMTLEELRENRYRERFPEFALPTRARLLLTTARVLHRAGQPDQAGRVAGLGIAEIESEARRHGGGLLPLFEQLRRGTFA